MIELLEPPGRLVVTGMQLSVIQVRLDHRFTLMCEDDDGDALEIVVEEDFRLILPDGETVIWHDNREGGAAGRAFRELFNEQIAECSITQPGAMLDVHTTSGKRLQVLPGPVYEAWSLAGPRFTLVGVNDHVDRFEGGEVVTVDPVGEWKRSVPPQP
jgi:Family of unknown function (DUF6188)